MKKSRPKELPGETWKAITGCGNLYVTMNWSEGKLFEVFASLGKSGGCSKCQCEALTRSISLGLRCEVPIEEYIKQLKGISCPSPVFTDGGKSLSCIDSIAKLLEEHGVKEPKEVSLLRGVI